MRKNFAVFSHTMKPNKIIISITFIFYFLSSARLIKALHKDCAEYFEGFLLPDSYNPNVPPKVENFTINNHIFVREITMVDEDNHRIAVDIHQMYYWNDNRINVNPDHPYWQEEVDNLSLDGAFVERCLWTPGLQFKDLNDLDVIRPTPTTSNGSPFKFAITPNGAVKVTLRNVHVTVSCYMDFDEYPFDQQVCFVGQEIFPISVGRSISLKLKNLNLTSILYWEDKGYQRDLQFTINNISQFKPNCTNPTNVGEFWFKVELKRNLRPYFVQIYLPTLLMVVISWSSFLIPPESYPGRFGLLVGLAICLINTLLNTVSNSPHIVGSNAIAVWIISCIFNITTAIIEYSGLLYFLQCKNKIGPDVEKSKYTKTKKNRNICECETSDNKWNSLNAKRRKIDAMAIVVIPAVFLVWILFYTFWFYDPLSTGIDPQVTKKKTIRMNTECELTRKILKKEY